MDQKNFETPLTSQSNNTVEWTEVSNNDPCPICHKPDWCSRSDNGNWVCCRRVHGSEAKRKTDRNGCPYFVYQLNGQETITQEKEESVEDVPAPNTIEDEDEITRAELSILDRVYSRLLDHLELSEEHESHLKDRGFQRSAIQKLGYRTLPDDDRNTITQSMEEDFERDTLLQVPGFYEQNNSIQLSGYPGLLIPARNVDGDIFALRIRTFSENDDVPKYMYLSSNSHGGPKAKVGVHVPVESLRSNELNPSSSEVRITEGEIAADLTTFLDSCLTVALPGVSQTADLSHVLKELGCQFVKLAFDRDVVENPHVSRALLRVQRFLEKRGYTVGVETWPGSNGKGIDDYFAYRMARQQKEIINGHETLKHHEAFEKVVEWHRKNTKESKGDRSFTIWETRIERLEKLSEDQLDSDYLLSEPVVRSLAICKIDDSTRFVRLRETLKSTDVNTNSLTSQVNTFVEKVKKERRERKLEQIQSTIGIKAIGETEHDDIVLFNEEKGKIKIVSKIDDLRYNDAVQLAGEEFLENVSSKRNQEDEELAYQDVKQKLVLRARDNPLTQMDKIGQGIHPLESGRILVISGASAAVFDLDRNQYESITESPILSDSYSSQKKFLGFSPGNEWIDFDDLQNRIERMGDLDERTRVLKKLKKCVGEWEFKEGDTDEWLIAGGVLQTIAQSFADWRPHYAFIGQASTGKSSFFKEFVSRMLKNLCPKVFDSGSTEAGMRQSLVNASTGASNHFFVIRDEFEQIGGLQRDKIMDWMRASNKGGTTIKGTADQEKTKRFEVSHSFWIGSTEFGGEFSEADWTRFLRFTLERPDGDLELPGLDELRNLGKDLVALSMIVVNDAKDQAKQLQSEMTDSDVPNRMVENHALPWSFLMQASDGEVDLPSFEQVLEDRKKETETISDHKKVLQRIFSHTVSNPVPISNSGSKLTIGRILNDYPGAYQEEFDRALANVGIKIPAKKEKVYFHPDTVRKTCLDEEFSKKNIKSYLLRHSGATEDRQRINGSSLRGVSISWDDLFDQECTTECTTEGGNNDEVFADDGEETDFQEERQSELVF